MLLDHRPDNLRGQNHQCPDQRQHGSHRDPHNPQRKQQQPNNRIDDQSHHRQGPAQHEQNAPEQKFDHVDGLVK